MRREHAFNPKNASLSPQGLVLAVPVTACLLKVLMQDNNGKALEDMRPAEGSSANFRPA